MKPDPAALRSAIEGATVLGLDFTDAAPQGQSPASVALRLRLRDGRRFTLDIWCELSREAAEALGQPWEVLEWGDHDPGLVYQACLFVDEGPVAKGQTDPLAEATAPVWTPPER